jgi:hypothetical protein
MRRTASEIIHDLQSRVARLEKQSSKIKETRWELEEDDIYHETWKKKFKDSEGRVTSRMIIKLYKKTRTPRGTGWSLEFKDFGQNIKQGHSFFYLPNESVSHTTDLVWERSDAKFYETKEEAVKASKKFISWLQRNYSDSFIYYQKDISGVDWAHDKYV